MLQVEFSYTIPQGAYISSFRLTVGDQSGGIGDGPRGSAASQEGGEESAADPRASPASSSVSRHSQSCGSAQNAGNINSSGSSSSLRLWVP